LIGASGAGKTVIVENLALEIKQKSNTWLNNKTIFYVNTSALVVDTRYSGEFEKKIQTLIDFCIKNRGKIILFIDEIHMLYGLGRTKDSSLDAMNILKPYIESGDIIIIGAGPSGLTSSIYCARENKKVLVIEKNIYGGQIISSPMIGNYPGFIQIDGVEFANKLYEQAKYLNVDFVYEKVVDIVDNFVKEVVTDKNVYKAKSIIIATGMDNRKTGIENENKYIGKGISYCATCDALEELIKTNKNKFKNLGKYEIINISGVDNPKEYKNI